MVSEPRVGNKPERTPRQAMPRRRLVCRNKPLRQKNKCKIEWCRDLASRPVFSRSQEFRSYEEGPGNQERRGPRGVSPTRRKRRQLNIS